MAQDFFLKKIQVGEISPNLVTLNTEPSIGGCSRITVFV